MIDTKEVTRAALQDAAKVTTSATVKIPRPKKREWAAATLMLLLGIAGLFAGKLGFIWPAFDVFSQLSAQFACGVVAFALAIFFIKRMTTTVGFVLTVLFCAIYGATAFDFIPRTAKSTEGSFRVLSYNIYKNNQNTNAIVASVKSANADIVALVELTDKNVQVLEDLRAIYPYSARCPTGSNCQQQILSRYPVSDAKVFYEPNLIIAEVALPTGSVNVIATHFKRFPNSRQQLTETQQLLKILDGVQRPLVIAGDFNATPFSRITAMISEQGRLTRLTSLPTWPTTLGIPQLAIDHIYISDELDLRVGPELGAAGGSDHYPVSATIGLKSKSN